MSDNPQVLARGIVSYHRPTQVVEALELVSHGAVPLAGGTRLLAAEAPLDAVVDLGDLDLAGLETKDGDLCLGALVTLQDVIDSPLSYAATAGLLPAACRAHSASRMIRGMATLGGESVHGAWDSEVVAALLALNAVYVVTRPEGTLDIPAVRFLRNPTADLAGGRLLTSLFVPGPPEGAALERVAVLPSAPSIVAVAVGVSFAGANCVRVRIALTGLETPPARVPEAESLVEGTTCDAGALGRCVEQISRRAPFRDDAHASASYRRTVAGTLVSRALRAAVERARSKAVAQAPRLPPGRRAFPPREGRAEFTSGTIELKINGRRREARAEARTTLLELLRREGFWGVKHGCETGECGVCAVLLEGRPVSACLTLALRAEGREVLTVEGLGDPDRLHPVQAAFVDTGAIQCGYCTPAMELCAKALLDAVPDPTEAEVRDALAGCLCRCTGYVKPVEAVLRAASSRRSSPGGSE